MGLERSDIENLLLSKISPEKYALIDDYHPSGKL